MHLVDHYIVRRSCPPEFVLETVLAIVQFVVFAGTFLMVLMVALTEFGGSFLCLACIRRIEQQHSYHTADPGVEFSAVRHKHSKLSRTI